MGTKPLPSIREAFSEVRREESRKKVMMGSQNSALSIEGSALVARGSPSNTNSENRQNNGRPWCDHCRKLGHSRENCWKIHGKLVDWKPSKPFNDRESSAHDVVVSKDKPTSTKTNPFTKEQLEMLQQLMSQNFLSQSSNLTSSTGMLAQKGNFSNAYVINKQHLNPWIIDSGASDHMTGDGTIFHEYNPYNEKYTVWIADGSLSKVAGIGLIRVSNDLNLNSILHGPNLDCNLLSINKLTRDLQCEAKFFSNLFKFQELDLGRMIGSAEMCSRLYLLKGDTPLRRQTQNASCVSFKSLSILDSCVNKDNEVTLWHYRLGHPNFMYLEKLFSSLFINKRPKFFSCEIY